MPARFVHQPFADGSDLHDFLNEVAADPTLADVQIAVAWVKRSGMRRIRPFFQAVKARGGTVRLVMGIDEGGGTRQGLELALELADHVHVFHDRSGRTFHPKVYLASGDGSARLLVGSHNLTAGGVYFNHEAGLIHELDLTVPQDTALHDHVLAYFAALRADEGVCKPLDQALLDLLCANPKFRIGDEDHTSRPPASTPGDDESEDRDGVAEDPLTSPFTSSTRAKKGDSLPRTGGGGGGRPHPASRHPSSSTTIGAAPQATVLARWTKKMSASDAQHPPSPNSAVTGNLRLSKAGHDINHYTYFRDVFFADAYWENVGDDDEYEKALVEMDTTISGTHLGVIPFRIDHMPGRISNQHNVPSVLKWGALSATRRQEDHRDEWIVIERLSDGTYRLTVQATQP